MRATTHFHERGSLLRYRNILRSGMGVRRISGKPRLILTSFVLALSSISPFTPKYELQFTLHEFYGYLYERKHTLQ